VSVRHFDDVARLCLSTFRASALTMRDLTIGVRLRAPKQVLMGLAAKSPTAPGASLPYDQGSDKIVLSETDRSRLQTCVHSGHDNARARSILMLMFQGGLYKSPPWSSMHYVVCAAHWVEMATFEALFGALFDISPGESL
jgi:hypothetical protein